MKRRCESLAWVLVACMCLAASRSSGGEAGGPEQLPRWRDWPNWRGYQCSGSAPDCGQAIVQDARDARLLWTSEEEMCGTYSGGPTIGGEANAKYKAWAQEQWGFSTFCIVDRRLYFYHPTPYGQATELSRRTWLENRTRAEVPEGLPTELLDTRARVRGTDVFMCLDAVTGRTLWKAEMEGRSVNQHYAKHLPYSPQNVPAWGDGRLFGMGHSRRVYAMDAVTGEPLWESDLGPAAWYLNYMYLDICEHSRLAPRWGRNAGDFAFNTCMIVADQAVVGRSSERGKQFRRESPHSGSSLTGFDVRTGRKLWRLDDGLLANNASPVRWTARNGKDYVIVQGHQKVLCLEPMTGKEVWRIDGPWEATVAASIPVTQDYLVVAGADDGAKGPTFARCYRITPEKAEPMWTVQASERSISNSMHAIYKDKVLLYNGKIVDLATGEVVKEGAGVPQYMYSVTAADDHIFTAKELWRIGAEEAGGLSYPDDFPGDPAVKCYGEANWVMGRLFTRGSHRWACWDMRKDPAVRDRYSKPVAPEHAVTVESAYEPVKALGSPYWTERMAAVENVSSYKPEMAADLAKLVTDAPYPTAKAASKVLCRMGAQARAAAPTLASALPGCAKDKGYGRVLLLTAAISAVDAEAYTPEVIDALAGLLATEDDLVRFRACRALEEAGPAAGPAAPALVELLKAEDEYTFRCAALTLASIGESAGQAATDELCRHLESKTPSVVVHSLVALTTVGGALPEAVVEQLLSWTFDPEAAAKAAPVTDFTGSGDPELDNYHYVSFLAGKCLSARPRQSLRPVMEHLAAAAKPREHKGGMRPGEPTLMHYRVLGQMGSAAEPALGLMQKYGRDLPSKWGAGSPILTDIAERWMNRIKPGAGTATEKKPIAGAGVTEQGDLSPKGTLNSPGAMSQPSLDLLELAP